VASSFVGYDSLGNALNVNVDAVFEGPNAAGQNVWRFYANSPNNVGGDPILGNGTITFDSAGNFVSATNATLSINRTGTGALTPQQITLNFSQLTSLSNLGHGSNINPVGGGGDGSPLGTLDSFAIGNDGVITGSFTNGLTRTLGQVAVANFTNPTGLIDQGGNQFSTGANSGTPIFTTAGQQGTGTIQGGALEQSNVDLSTEFTNLIIATTGFSAASKVITTSDQLITDLLNSNR
jgi:flagellar hook protein FlgE